MATNGCDTGGQKHRVALARACYADADVLLLDDPLSAVDAHVGRHLFDACLCGLLAHKTRILVTHQTQFLCQADSIVMMARGRITDRGTYDELTSKGINFAEFKMAEEEAAVMERVEGVDATIGAAAGSPTSPDAVVAVVAPALVKAEDAPVVAVAAPAVRASPVNCLVVLVLATGKPAACRYDHTITMLLTCRSIQHTCRSNTSVQRITFIMPKPKIDFSIQGQINN